MANEVGFTGGTNIFSGRGWQEERGDGKEETPNADARRRIEEGTEKACRTLTPDTYSIRDKQLKARG
jgi:hypothetical protein